MDPKVSVAFITYNHASFIESALESVLCQEVDFDYEVVIGDDFSTDETSQIVNRFYLENPDKIRVLSRERNLGYPANFNDTLLQCKGRYIATMDGDDLMLPGKLQKMAAFLDENPECIMVAHDLVEFDSKTGKIIRIIKPRKNKDRYDLQDFVRYGSIFGNSSKMFKKEALPSQPVHPEIEVIADYYQTLHTVDDHQVGYIPLVLGKYRSHASSLMKVTKGRQVFHDIKFTLDSITEKYGSRYGPYYGNMMAYAYLMAGIEEFHHENFPKAREELMNSLKANWHYTRAQYFYLILSFLPRFLRKAFRSLGKK